MYTFHNLTGEVTRDSDGVVVSPTSLVTDAGYLEYVAWVKAGNTPAVVVESAKEIAQREVWEAIKKLWDIKKYSGLKVGENWFHSDTDSRIQQIALNDLGDNIPEGLMWKILTVEGGLYAATEIAMTKELAHQIFINTVLSDNALYRAAQNHREAMLLVDDPYSYDYTVNWPETFSDLKAT